MNQQQSENVIEPFDVVEKYSQPQFAKYIVILGFMFFGGLWAFIYFNFGKVTKILKYMPENLLFIDLFLIGILFVKSILNLLFNKPLVGVEDKGMMSGYAYKSASDNKFRNWMIAAMLSAGHAILFILMRW